MVVVPNLKLSSGHDMPQVGFGLWKVPNAECPDVVYNAIKEGYRLFDGACDYGNEVECGQGVTRAIKDGLVKREDLFLVSKLWNSFHDPEQVEKICRRQLADWNLEYFDLFIMHFPVALKYVDPSVRYPPGWFDENDEIVLSKTTIHETWAAMEKLVELGLAKSIGVSNFQAQSVYELLRTAKIRPATLQVEHHPYLVQPELMRMAKNEGIAVTAYSSFGPMSFLDFNMKDAVAMKPLMAHDTIKAIAAKHGVPPANVLLRWSTQQGLAIIPKTTTVDQMRQNLAHLELTLTDEDIEEINAMDKHFRFNQPNNYFPTEMLWIFG